MKLPRITLEPWAAFKAVVDAGSFDRGLRHDGTRRSDHAHDAVDDAVEHDDVA